MFSVLGVGRAIKKTDKEGPACMYLEFYFMESGLK